MRKKNLCLAGILDSPSFRTGGRLQPVQRHEGPETPQTNQFSCFAKTHIGPISPTLGVRLGCHFPLF